MTQTQNTQHTNISRDPFDVVSTAAMEVVWQIMRAVFVAAWWAVLFPMVSLPLCVAVVVGVWVSWLAGVVVVGVFIVGIMLWRRRCPQMFERWITRRARTRYVSWRRYRRRWVHDLTSCNLAVRDSDTGAVEVPRLLAVEIGHSVDRVRVRMLAGQCPADYTHRAERLATTFTSHECRAVLSGPGVMDLLLRHGESFVEPIPLPQSQAARLRSIGKEAA